MIKFLYKSFVTKNINRILFLDCSKSFNENLFKVIK